MNELQLLRNGIDEIDQQILDLFKQRMELCKDVAEYKRSHEMPVFQGGREQQIIDRIKALTGDPSLEAGTAALFTTIMDISKILQNRRILANSNEYSTSLPNIPGQQKNHVLSHLRRRFQGCAVRRTRLRHSACT